MQMEKLTAIRMRDVLRSYFTCFGEYPVYFSDITEALFFVRFTVPLEPAREQQMFAGLRELGYMYEITGNRILILPGDELIRQYSGIAERSIKPGLRGCLSGRLMLHSSEDEMTKNGRQLIIDTLRLAKGMPEPGNSLLMDQGYAGQLPAIRTQIKKIRQRTAILLRKREFSGLYEAGVFLGEMEALTLLSL